MGTGRVQGRYKGYRTGTGQLPGVQGSYRGTGQVQGSYKGLMTYFEVLHHHFGVTTNTSQHVEFFHSLIFCVFARAGKN